MCIKSNLYAIALPCDDDDGGGEKGGGGGGGDNSAQGRYSLYKLFLGNSLRDSTTSTQVDKQLVMKNIALNLDKFQIDISNEVHQIINIFEMPLSFFKSLSSLLLTGNLSSVSRWTQTFVHI